MKRFTRYSAVLAALSISVFALAGPAGAIKAKPKPKPLHPQIIVTISPNPLIETGTSNVAAVIQVECVPSDCANNKITISSTQLVNHCIGPVTYETIFGASPSTPITSVGSITLAADNDGNTAVVVTATNCSSGTSLITADLNAPPFFTGTTKLTVLPPQVTPVSLKGYPPNEVEVGDGGTGMGLYGESDVYIVFYVEAPPVFAEQFVTITSDQLTARCGLGYRWENSAGQSGPVLLTGIPGTNGPAFAAFTATTSTTAGIVVGSTIDNDGNAVFIFKGASCAAGKSTVIADVQNNGPTLSTIYNILPPQVTV